MILQKKEINIVDPINFVVIYNFHIIDVSRFTYRVINLINSKIYYFFILLHFFKLIIQIKIRFLIQFSIFQNVLLNYHNDQQMYYPLHLLGNLALRFQMEKHFLVSYTFQ